MSLSSLDSSHFKVIEPGILPVVSSSIVADCPRLSSRYSVHVSFYPMTNEYLLVVRNFNVFVQSSTGEHDYMPNFTYQLLDKGLSKADAHAIQIIFSSYLYPQVRKKGKISLRNTINNRKKFK